MKVILVGLHNKPDLPPLSVVTKSGALLNQVIKLLPEIEFIKSNLYDLDHFPTNEDDNWQLACDWHYRVNPEPEDLIVLLGAHVHNNFLYDKTAAKKVKFAHPASIRSHEKMNNYVAKMIQTIENHQPTNETL